jgi:hypothetical protein
MVYDTLLCDISLPEHPVLMSDLEHATPNTWCICRVQLPLHQKEF